MKKIVFLACFVFLASLALAQNSQGSNQSRAYDYSKILNWDLSDFTGYWVNGENDRIFLLPDGTRHYEEEAYNFTKNESGVYSWRSVNSKEGYGYRVWLYPVGVEVLNVYDGTVVPTDKTKVRLHAGHESPYNAATIFYMETNAAAQSADADFETKANEGGGVTITKYVGWDTEVVIPAAIGGVPVRAIGKEAFRDAGLTSITIPEGIVEIGPDAFQNNKLTGVIIPGTVKTIQAGAFTRNLLTEAVILEGVVEIGAKAFENNKLTKITIPGTVKTVQESAFADNLLTEAVILEGVVEIGAKAFENNKLTTITIPGTVKTIWGAAFANNLLTEVVILEGVTTISGKGSTYLSRPPFEGNTLKSITLPASIRNLSKLGGNPATIILGEKMGGNSDEVWAALGTAIFNNYIANGRKAGAYTQDMPCVEKKDGDFTYYDTQYGAVLASWNNSEKVTRLRIPQELGGAAVKAIGIYVYRLFGSDSIAYAFQRRELANILIPEGITYIGDQAFNDNKLTQLTLPSTITYIGDSAFTYNQITQITLPASVQYVGDNAFDYNNITRVTLLGDIAYIGDRVFGKNTSTSFQLPNDKNHFPIGSTGPAGGIVFYDKGNDSGGWRYLEAASRDMGTAEWGSSRTSIGGTANDIGSGKENTRRIVERLNNSRETGRAAQLCSGYTQGGFTDWFLPSYEELKLMYNNLKASGLGGFADEVYWSSSEQFNSSVYANALHFGGGVNTTVKDAAFRVRAIRAFSGSEPVSVATAQEQATDSAYAFDTGTATITKYIGLGGAVVIPEKIAGIPVKAVGKEAFKGASLTSVTISEGLESIDEQAFKNVKLASVSLPASLKRMGGGVFDYTDGFIIVIGSNVTVQTEYRTGMFSVDDSFGQFYTQNGKKAGRYRYTKIPNQFESSKNWSYTAQQTPLAAGALGSQNNPYDWSSLEKQKQSIKSGITVRDWVRVKNGRVRHPEQSELTWLKGL